MRNIFNNTNSEADSYELSDAGIRSRYSLWFDDQFSDPFGLDDIREITVVSAVESESETGRFGDPL